METPSRYVLFHLYHPFDTPHVDVVAKTPDQVKSLLSVLIKYITRPLEFPPYIWYYWVYDGGRGPIELIDGYYSFTDGESIESVTMSVKYKWVFIDEF